MNKNLLAALLLSNAVTAAVTTTVVATPPLADLYYHYRVDEIDNVTVVPRGPCEYADGGVDADGGHVVGPIVSVPVLDRDGGPTGQCWTTRLTAVAYPQVQGLQTLPCEASLTTGAAEAPIIKAMIKGRLLPLCTAKTTIPTE